MPDGVASGRVNFPHGVKTTAAVSEDGYLLTAPASVKHEREALAHKLERSLPGAKAKHLSKKQALKLFETVLAEVGKITLETSPTSVEWLNASGAVIHTETRAELLAIGGTEGSSSLTGLTLRAKTVAPLTVPLGS